MQPKIDGIRVIIYRGEPFTRLGKPLSPSKGAAELRAMFKGLDETLDGEWVPTEGKYYAFDLPDEPGDSTLASECCPGSKPSRLRVWSSWTPTGVTSRGFMGCCHGRQPRARFSSAAQACAPSSPAHPRRLAIGSNGGLHGTKLA
jgi:hypothetical protein